VPCKPAGGRGGGGKDLKKGGKISGGGDHATGRGLWKRGRIVKVKRTRRKTGGGKIALWGEWRGKIGVWEREEVFALVRQKTEEGNRGGGKE